jgi:4-amino-4-deoxy-L-arabinose transferase-like glycosyltransferase
MHTEQRLSRAKFIWYLCATALAIFVYLFGLDSQYIPKNGDEFPYAHITRLTAESGHLLPLQSGLDQMRNTKPPLLFWQGIFTTNQGQDWTLWRLRYPSVIYTLFTAWLVALLAWRLSHKSELGFFAALTFLAFFSSYRYGRPFLVNPAETFWLFLPFFTLLYWRDTAFASIRLPWLLGIEIGIGLLYKSFALLAPVGLGLAWWYLYLGDYNLKKFLRNDAVKLVCIAMVALALFALWFVYDPDPHAIWDEFVIGENASKFDAHSGSYFGSLLWGGSSVWTMLLGYPLNAGLLAFPIMAMMVHSFRFRERLIEGEKLLWFWCIVLMVIFSIPSQRSARYLLDAMPALAVLCALSWNRISRYFFMLTLFLVWVLLVLLASLALRLQQDVPAFNAYYGLWFWGVLAVTALLVFAGMFVAHFTRPVVNVAVLLGYLVLTLFLRPLDGPLGTYANDSINEARGQDVWVPCNFRAGEEGHRFLLPGSTIHGYRDDLKLTADEMAERYPMFAMRVPVQQTILDCQHCKIIGQRLDVRSRHNDQELQAMLYGEVYEHLFIKEWLVASTRLDSRAEANRIDEGCR